MTRTLIRATTVAAAAALVLPAARLVARSGPEGTKTLYLSVLDESGKPVKDMTADQLAMREDGKDIQIISVGPAQEPLQVVFLVDTSDSATQLTSAAPSAHSSSNCTVSGTMPRSNSWSSGRPPSRRRRSRRTTRC
jgi:hypothetical protein